MREQVAKLDEQIKKLRETRRRWANGRDLTVDEKAKQHLTLEMLDSTIEDLLAQKRSLKSHIE
jgi:hypothetical protein